VEESSNGDGNSNVALKVLPNMGFLLHISVQSITDNRHGILLLLPKAKFALVAEKGWKYKERLVKVRLLPSSSHLILLSLY
jgi:hypothetical protein